MCLRPSLFVDIFYVVPAMEKAVKQSYGVFYSYVVTFWRVAARPLASISCGYCHSQPSALDSAFGPA